MKAHFRPGKVVLHTEYYLYDFISTLGNVGGTLGLFIGFSFTGAFSYFLNLITKTNGANGKDQTSKKNQIIQVKGKQDN